MAEPILKNEMFPLVTVAMPVFNAGEYLRLAILSIIKQTYTNWELLLVDDGSTDKAVENIADIDDARIRILRDGKNKGLAARLNECIDLARGKYIARMDQDDVSYPERFAQQIEVLQCNSNLDLVAVRAIAINENNVATSIFPYSLSHNEICTQPWKGFYLPHPTWMGKIEWFRKYHYTIPGPYLCEDQELLLRSYSESQFATVNEILFAYRIRSEVNQKKLLLTRWAVLKAQFRVFQRSNLWLFIVLSIATFLIKIGNDLVSQIKKSDFKYKHENINALDESKWKNILNSIEKDCTT